MAAAYCTLGTLHSDLLQVMASQTGQHFQGLSQASRTKKLNLTNRQKKMLSQVDIAWNIIRHISTVRAMETLREFRALDSTSCDLRAAQADSKESDLDEDV